jgi:O-succinylbenzoic acid--CoA ligase
MAMGGVPESELAPIRRALTDGIVVETSGSTARPKRVDLSANAIHASVAATAAAIGEGGWVLALPLSYIAGIMVVARALVAGTPLVDLRAEPFVARRYADAVAALPVGRWFTSLVPAQLQRLVDLAERDAVVRTALTRFDRILVGGQAIAPELIDRAIELGARVTKTYGSAETAGGVVYDGHPIGDTRIRIDDGRVCIATSSLANGYLGDDAQTAEAFTVDTDGTRWWRTSDAGEFDGTTLRVSGRLDDIIVTGGVKVSLGDIDRVLHDANIDAVAGWFSDDEWGQVPGIVTTSEVELDVVRDLIETALGKAARPYRSVRVESIPTLTSGKLDRRTVNEIVARGHA